MDSPASKLYSPNTRKGKTGTDESSNEDIGKGRKIRQIKSIDTQILEGIEFQIELYYKAAIESVKKDAAVAKKPYTIPTFPVIHLSSEEREMLLWLKENLCEEVLPWNGILDSDNTTIIYADNALETIRALNIDKVEEVLSWPLTSTSTSLSGGAKVVDDVQEWFDQNNPSTIELFQKLELATDNRVQMWLIEKLLLPEHVRVTMEGEDGPFKNISLGILQR